MSVSFLFALCFTFRVEPRNLDFSEIVAHREEKKLVSELSDLSCFQYENAEVLRVCMCFLLLCLSLSFSLS